MTEIKKNGNSRITVVTEAMAKPKNEREATEAMMNVVNSLRGSNGQGEWDGGLAGTGYWVKYSMFWDGKLTFDGTGSTTITFPFTVIDSMVKVYAVATNTVKNYYVSNSKTLDVSGLTGKTIVEITFVKNGKE